MHVTIQYINTTRVMQLENKIEYKIRTLVCLKLA